MRWIAAQRGMAGNLLRLGPGFLVSRKSVGRLQDKSTAVGRGAGGWFYCAFSAIGHAAKLALSPEAPAKPSANAPSPASDTRWKALQ